MTTKTKILDRLGLKTVAEFDAKQLNAQFSFLDSLTLTSDNERNYILYIYYYGFYHQFPDHLDYEDEIRAQMRDGFILDSPEMHLLHPERFNGRESMSYSMRLSFARIKYDSRQAARRAFSPNQHLPIVRAAADGNAFAEKCLRHLDKCRQHLQLEKIP